MNSNFIRLSISIAAIITFSYLYGCNSGSSWEEVEEADTYEAYQNYIESNPDGEHIEQAKLRADSLYWDSVTADTIADSFETYLEQFPEGQFREEAQAKIDELTRSALSTEARVIGSGVIIRSDHTTASSSAGVVAREGTVVEILDRYIAGNSVEAILKNDVTVEIRGQRIQLSSGKAIRIISDDDESVRASFITTEFGRAEASINKSDIEATDGQTWYQIRTKDGITGWIFGKFIEEI